MIKSLQLHSTGGTQGTRQATGQPVIENSATHFSGKQLPASA